MKVLGRKAQTVELKMGALKFEIMWRGQSVESLWTITKNAAGNHAAREHKLHKRKAQYLPTENVIRATTLESIRDLIQPACNERLPRTPGDDPAVVEYWF